MPLALARCALSVVVAIMAAIDTNPTQAWLGNIPIDFISADVIRELEVLGYATLVEINLVSKAGHKTSFAIVSFSSTFDADFVKQHGLYWSNGKYAIVRTIPLYMTMSPPICCRGNCQPVFRINSVLHGVHHLFVFV